MPRRIFFGVGGEKIIVAENKIFLLQSAGIFFAALIFLWSWRRKIIVAENKIIPVTIGGIFSFGAAGNFWRGGEILSKCFISLKGAC
ncbi:MAG: hypothetical protein SR3Q1_06870 [Quinella sp. 3Q1]|nr:hypothetical protein [Quinella sp. 3Q1]